jgi:hypothetical protein
MRQGEIYTGIWGIGGSAIFHLCWSREVASTKLFIGLRLVIKQYSLNLLNTKCFDYILLS